MVLRLGTIFKILQLAVVSIVVIATLTGCNSMFYQPDRYLHSKPEHFNLDYSDFWIDSEEGVKLHGWHLKRLMPKGKSEGLIVFFHGNAENISTHYLNLAWITKHDYDLMIFDYRGYGRSSGSATYSGVDHDGRRFLDYAHTVFKKGEYKRFIVYGQSLGGAVASRIMCDKRYQKMSDLLVLDSTFMSYEKIAVDRLQVLWLTYIFSPLAYLLISDSLSAKSCIGTIETPTLVVHGEIDPVIPVSFGQRIYDSLTHKKWLWRIEGGRHIDIFSGHDRKYRKKFIQFLSEI